VATTTELYQSDTLTGRVIDTALEKAEEGMEAVHTPAGRAAVNIEHCTAAPPATESDTVAPPGLHVSRPAASATK
jgi:ABC-type protease/lipase transport system fused ATPase/permease subunit